MIRLPAKDEAATRKKPRMHHTLVDGGSIRVAELILLILHHCITDPAADSSYYPSDHSRPHNIRRK